MSPSSYFSGFDMSNLVGRTNSYVATDDSPQHLPEVVHNEQLLLLSNAPGPAADAFSRRQELTTLFKRTLGVSHSSSTSSAPPSGAGMANDRRRTRPVRISAASVQLPRPALCATIPAPRHGSHANAAIPGQATIAPNSCGSQPSNLHREHPPNEKHCCLFLATCWTAA